MSDHAETSVSTRYVNSVVATAVDLGADPSALLRGTGVSADRPAVSERVPSPVVRVIWDRALDHLGDRRFGLRVGGRLRPGAYHVLGHAVLACPTLQDAARLTMRFHRLVSDAGTLCFTRDAGRAVLRYRRHTPPGDADTQQTEAVLAGIVAAARWLSPENWRPSRVTFTHPAPVGPTQAWDAVFGAPVAFRAADNRIEWPAARMDALLPYGDPDLLGLHRAYAEQLLAGKPGRPPVHRRAAHWLLGQDLATVRPDDLARALNMSTRSLRRALHENGTSWRDLLDQARHRLAVRGVTRSDQSLAEIARRLGYSDTSSFVRAFHRWESMPPGRYARARTERRNPSG
ncbi:AraC family transcriptional regulator [Streptomyces sp. TRM64462]|uniref:AraC family transcriptional regulator n=1 Tax=Streptomyces sp. TRM64462 TaxID=2741726 RepID=UPI001585E31A|nr:AraC family transcriptional regulator [Streptomyces sp. TRM64462]